MVRVADDQHAECRILILVVHLGLNVFTTVLAHEITDHLTAADMHVYTADVTSDDDIKKLCDGVSEATGGTLDVLVNCA